MAIISLSTPPDHYFGILFLFRKHHNTAIRPSLQFVLLYFHDIRPKKIIIKERNYKNLNEREFLETVQNLNIEEILCLSDKDPNISITNLYNNINYLLDEFAPL